MTAFPRSRLALASLLAAGLLAGASSGCEVPSDAPSPSEASAAPRPGTLVEPAVAAKAPAVECPPAKETGNAITLGERQTFHSTILGADRTLFVATPAGYEKGKAAYPVLYLLDGEDHFHHTTGITSFLARGGRAPEMIVVGVTNLGGIRERDLTPTEPKDRPGHGGGARFLAFLKDEVRPRIEGAYRTAPYQILVGHSLGGLFAIEALASAPEAFKAYIAISPSLWWDDKHALGEAERSFISHPGLEAFLYFTVGSEGGNMLEGVTSFAALLKAKAPRGLTWNFKPMEHESHATIPHRSTYDAIEALFAGWEPPKEVETVKALEAHYEALSKRLHFEVSPSEDMINNFGYRLILEKHRDEALAAFKLNVQRHPGSPNAYDSLADAYDDRGQSDLARENREVAVRKATESSDPLLSELKARLAQQLSRLKSKK